MVENKNKKKENYCYCITGGGGLVASHLIQTLLLHGHTVRATLRSLENEEKVGFLRKMKGAKERLTLYKADLMVDGSFDEAFHGVHGVFHVACPVLSPKDGDDIETLVIDPCVKGTLNVLKSCSKASSSVKRVVLTSSTYAINQRDDVNQLSPLNESHWSDLEHCKRHNKWYAYAKTLAEKKAWEIAQQKGLDLVVVHPSFVIGPSLSPQPTSTIKFVLDLIKGSHGGYPNRCVRFVHVEDVVGAHILAMEEKKASGRLICSGSVAHWADIITMLKAKYPRYPYESKPIRHEDGDNQHSLDVSKIMELGFPGFKTIPQMFDDCITSFQEKGFL